MVVMCRGGMCVVVAVASCLCMVVVGAMSMLCSVVVVLMS